VRNVLLAAVVVMAVFLQISFLPALRPFGVVPDIMLPIVVFVGLYGQASTALVVALVGGLAMDMASSSDFGLWTGTFVLAALVCGYVHRAGVELIAPVAVIMVTVATVLANAVLLTSVFGATGPWSSVAGSLIIQVVLNFILTMAIGPLIKAVVGSGSSGAEMMIG
jgi:rod shape-determining protein MreD